MKITASHTSICSLLGTIALSTLALTACSKADAPKPTTQVAAKVGSEEISMHQINAVLAMDNTRGATPEQIQVRSRAILEGLIDQQVAIDQAMETKLNRAPEVIAQIEAARRQVLSTAYVKQFASSLPKPDDQEATKYFSDHPALFAERRIFNVQEIVTENNPEVLSQLNRMAAADAPMETVAFWLKGNKTPFSSGSSSRSAEQIPMELLPRMHALQDGQDAIFPSSTSITILRLVSSQKAPIAELAARPRIAQYLNTQHVSIAITEHMKELRNKTTVVYAGEFAHPLSVLEVKPTAAPVAATVAAHAESTNAVRSTLEKGVAGLK